VSKPNNEKDYPKVVRSQKDSWKEKTSAPIRKKKTVGRGGLEGEKT